MGIVVRLANYRRSQPGRSVRPDPSTRVTGLADFTLRDRADLRDWEMPGRHSAICTCDMGTYAMLYLGGSSWASWGVVRQGRGVLLWDCVTLADIGRFDSVAEALAAIPATGSLPPPKGLLRLGGPTHRLAHRSAAR